LVDILLEFQLRGIYEKRTSGMLVHLQTYDCNDTLKDVHDQFRNKSTPSWYRGWWTWLSWFGPIVDFCQ
jgi:hypothetical protein